MVDRNDPLLREVDEELRRERFEKLWEQYGMYMLAAAAILVAMVGGYKLWETRQHSLATAGGAQYEAALKLIEANKNDEAQKALNEIIAGGQKGYTPLSQLQLAGLHLSAGRPKEALAVFEALATSSTADTDMKTFAGLQAASLRLGEADFTEMQNRLNALVEGTSAWRIPARELLGTAAYKAGKLEEARKLLQPLLADPQSPRGTLQRVQLVLGAIAAAEVQKVAPAAAPSPAAPAASAPAAPDSGAKQAPKSPEAEKSAPEAK
jgi:hypothetical protein